VRTRLIPVVVTLPLVLATVSCSDDGGEAAANEPLPTVSIAETSGDSCSDPIGDLGTDATAEGVLTEPSGIDLVGAEAVLDGSGVEVVFVVAGDPALAPVPVFTVFQGSPGDLTSWELQLRLAESGWQTELTTYQPGGQLVTEGERRTLPVTPSVVPTDTGAEVSVQVPADLMPPTATLLWGFGSSSAAGDGITVFDDCDAMADQVVPTPGG
jgi:hypothetical protein